MLPGKMPILKSLNVDLRDRDRNSACKIFPNCTTQDPPVKPRFKSIAKRVAPGAG